MFALRYASKNLLVKHAIAALAALLARPTFGGLWSQNCLKEGHVLW